VELIFKYTEQQTPAMTSSSSGIGQSNTGNDATTSPYQHCCWSSPKILGSPPEPRLGHSADVIGSNRIYIFGGRNGTKAMNDLYIFETDKMVWKEEPARNPPSKRNAVSPVCLCLIDDNRMGLIDDTNKKANSNKQQQ